MAHAIARMVAAAALLPLFLSFGVPAQPAAVPGEGARQDARINALREQLKKDPDNPEIVYQLARTLSLRGRTAEAARQFERILAVYPDNADYLLGQGQNFLWGGQPARAVPPLRRALKLAPRYQEVYRALAQALVATGQRAEAREIYAQADKRFNRPQWAIDGLAALDAPKVAAAPAPSPAPSVQPEPAVASAPAPVVPEPATPTPPVIVGPAATAVPIVLADQTGRRNSLEAGYVRETLSTNPHVWRDAYAQYLHQFAPRTVLLGRITESSRFGLDDTTLLAAGYLPLGAKTTLFAEAAVSPTHRVLPAHTLHGQINQQLVHGWGVQGGWKHLTYNTTAVDVVDITVERYFGPFRAAFTATPSRSRTAGRASSQRLQLGYYYGDGSTLQVSVSSGTEVDKPSAAGEVIRMDVRNASLFGQHALNADWVLVYGVGYTEQDNTVRKAANAGLRFRF